MENFEPKFRLYPNIKLTQPVVVGFDYKITEIKLFEYLNITVYLYDHKGQTLEIRFLKMDGQDYNEWVDDNQVINWIKKQLSA